MRDRDRDEMEAMGDSDWTDSARTQSEAKVDERQKKEPARRELALEETFGSVTPFRRPEDFKELSRLAKEEKVARTLAELDQQSQQ